MSFKVVDLFCGCGGLSYGFHKEKYNIIESYDFFDKAIKSYRLNYKKTNAINIDISRVSFLSLKNKVDLVIGGPPCQPFSVVGKQKGNSDLRDMVPEFIRVVKECSPKVFIMENVSGLTSKKNKDYFNNVIKEFHRLGYKTNYEVLDFRDWGVPQKRKRLILIGSLKEIIPMPKKEFSEDNYVVLSDILPVDNVKKNSLSDIIYMKSPLVKGTFASSLLVNGKGRPIYMNEQSNTITASVGNAIHFIDNQKFFEKYYQSLKSGKISKRGSCSEVGIRRLYFEEMSAIQTFPKDYLFYGSTSDKIKQVGNAVPPKFSEYLAKHIKQFL